MNNELNKRYRDAKIESLDDGFIVTLYVGSDLEKKSVATSFQDVVTTLEKQFGSRNIN
jgi:hypothetical protein